MNQPVRIPLVTQAPQKLQLAALQEAFARVCNTLAPLVQQTRCWNRVALHHMTYRQLRAQFPELGSQMICNAIYSVSRTSRHIYQHPSSNFNVNKLGDKPLPLLRFQTQSPVYFDRHTLSIKAGQISMLTLDGRMQFELAVKAEVEERFRTAKLREIVLKQHNGEFVLDFTFADVDNADGPAATFDDLPEYVLVTYAIPPQAQQSAAVMTL